MLGRSSSIAPDASIDETITEAVLEEQSAVSSIESEVGTYSNINNTASDITNSTGGTIN